MLGKAIAIAAEAHQEQKDRGGKPYILHPIRIMMGLNTEDQELMSIAILHDVIEDSDWTLEALKSQGFRERVLKGVLALTHIEGEEYEDYIERISRNKDAIRCKLGDLKDNSDITRLKGLSDKDLLRTRKYHKAFMFLKGKLED